MVQYMVKLSNLWYLYSKYRCCLPSKLEVTGWNCTWLARLMKRLLTWKVRSPSHFLRSPEEVCLKQEMAKYCHAVGYCPNQQIEANYEQKPEKKLTSNNFHFVSGCSTYIYNSGSYLIYMIVPFRVFNTPAQREVAPLSLLLPFQMQTHYC